MVKNHVIPIRHLFRYATKINPVVAIAPPYPRFREHFKPLRPTQSTPVISQSGVVNCCPRRCPPPGSVDLNPQSDQERARLVFDQSGLESRPEQPLEQRSPGVSPTTPMSRDTGAASMILKHSTIRRWNRVTVQDVAINCGRRFRLSPRKALVNVLG